VRSADPVRKGGYVLFRDGSGRKIEPNKARLRASRDRPTEIVALIELLEKILV
jgi:hypothetical protein